MAFRARVFLQRVPSPEEYLGVIDLSYRPVLNGVATFIHNGKREGGHIESITPSDWNAKGVIPTLRVVQRQRD